MSLLAVQTSVVETCIGLAHKQIKQLKDLIVKYTVSLYVTFWCVTFDKSSTFQLTMLIQIAWAPVKQEKRKPCLNV